MKVKIIFIAIGVIALGWIVVSLRQTHPDLYTNDNATGMCTLWTYLKEDSSGFTVKGPFSKTANPHAPCPDTTLRVVSTY